MNKDLTFEEALNELEEIVNSMERGEISLEEAIKNLDFNKTYIYQPPVLIRQAELIRTGEKILVKILRLFNQLGLFESQKPLPVSSLAQKMIQEIKSESTERLNIYTPIDFSAAQSQI